MAGEKKSETERSLETDKILLAGTNAINVFVIKDMRDLIRRGRWMLNEEERSKLAERAQRLANTANNINRLLKDLAEMQIIEITGTPSTDLTVQSTDHLTVAQRRVMEDRELLERGRITFDKKVYKPEELELSLPALRLMQAWTNLPPGPARRYDFMKKTNFYDHRNDRGREDAFRQGWKQLHALRTPNDDMVFDSRGKTHHPLYVALREVKLNHLVIPATPGIEALPPLEQKG